MNDTGVIDQFLSVFSTYIDSGFGLLGGEVGFLSSTLIVIDVTIAALFWAPFTLLRAIDKIPEIC